MGLYSIDVLYLKAGNQSCPNYNYKQKHHELLKIQMLSSAFLLATLMLSQTPEVCSKTLWQSSKI
jgi:hypothetical protein